jgi:hypothetical protein
MQQSRLRDPSVKGHELSQWGGRREPVDTVRSIRHNQLRASAATPMSDVARRATTMPGFKSGRLLGMAWCCTIDEHGVERDVAFGWTRDQARRRCLRRGQRRTGLASVLDA